MTTSRRQGAARRAHAALLCSCILLAVTAGGCLGYRHERLIRPDVDTVYVSFVDNDTFRRELEVELTDAVENEILTRTPLLLAPRDGADTILSGTVSVIEERTQIRSEDEVILKRRVSAVVSFSWVDARTGAELLAQPEIEESVRIVVGLEDTKFGLLFGETAKRIVDHMEEPW